MNNLKKIRKEKKLTLQEVADYLNVTNQYFSYVENGKKKLNSKTLEKLAQLFEVSEDEIIGTQNLEIRSLYDHIKNVNEYFKSNPGILKINDNDYDYVIFRKQKDQVLLKILDFLTTVNNDDHLDMIKQLAEVLSVLNSNSVIFRGYLNKYDIITENLQKSLDGLITKLTAVKKELK